MSDKLREDFEKHESSLSGEEYMPGSYVITEDGFYNDYKMQERWEAYKAATERAARICDRKLTDCTHSYTASVLTRLAKEIRGE